MNNSSCLGLNRVNYSTVRKLDIFTEILSDPGFLLLVSTPLGLLQSTIQLNHGVNCYTGFILELAIV